MNDDAVALKELEPCRSRACSRYEHLGEPGSPPRLHRGQAPLQPKPTYRVGARLPAMNDDAVALKELEPCRSRACSRYEHLGEPGSPPRLHRGQAPLSQG